MVSSPESEFDMKKINSEYKAVSPEMRRFISTLVRQSSTSVGYSIVVMIINVFFRFSTNRLRRREVTAALHGLSHHSLHHEIYCYTSRNNRPSDTTLLLNFVLDTHIIPHFFLPRYSGHLCCISLISGFSALPTGPWFFQWKKLKT